MNARTHPLWGAALMGAVACLFGYSVWDAVASRAVSPERPAGTAAQAAPVSAAERAKAAALSRFSSNEAVRAGLALHPAEYWEALADDIVQCKLCPRACTIPDGYRGACRARVNIGGALRSLVYGRLVAMNVDPIEKKPLFHFLPATRSFSVAAAGCNMNCLFCQNWQISQALPEQTGFKLVMPAEVVAAARASKCSSIAFTYTEPTIFFEYMRDTAKLAHEAGIATVLITCGFIQEAPLRELCAYIDGANVDLKGFSSASYKEYTSGELEPVLRALKVLKQSNVWTEVGNLVIPGANDSDTELSNLCAWVAAEMGKDTPLHFLRFHPDNKLTERPPTPASTLERAVSFAQQAGIKYVYTGNLAGSTHENTCCPRCGKAVIERTGIWIRALNMKDGACAFCGAKIAGIWTKQAEPTTQR